MKEEISLELKALRHRLEKASNALHDLIQTTEKIRIAHDEVRVVVFKSRRAIFKKGLSHHLPTRTKSRIQSLYYALDAEAQAQAQATPRQRLQESVFLEKLEHPFPNR